MSSPEGPGEPERDETGSRATLTPPAGPADQAAGPGGCGAAEVAGPPSVWQAPSYRPRPAPKPTLAPAPSEGEAATPSHFAPPTGVPYQRVRPRHAGPPVSHGMVKLSYVPPPVSKAMNAHTQPIPRVGATPEGERPDSSQRRPAGVSPWLFAAAVCALVTVVAVLGFITPGFFTTKVLDHAAVQNGVRTVLRNDYRMPDVSDVLCPSDQKVRPGTTFDCVARINQHLVKVRVIVQDRDGRYQVGRPS
ncbi:MAG TPA: DUF4333 domain-containing protein [Pseudonocardia sp.]|uniref:DUF4333 domain-containing protein n=1 Tax=Pseudonocardia sp. TaxID=60912 RepID=UPI002F42B4A8